MMLCCRRFFRLCTGLLCLGGIIDRPPDVACRPQIHVITTCHLYRLFSCFCTFITSRSCVSQYRPEDRLDTSSRYTLERNTRQKVPLKTAAFGLSSFVETPGFVDYLLDVRHSSGSTVASRYACSTTYTAGLTTSTRPLCRRRRIKSLCSHKERGWVGSPRYSRTM